MHPNEEKLEVVCKKIRLDDKRIKLLKDLLGWNNPGEFCPISYKGIEPQASLVRDVRIWAEKEADPLLDTGETAREISNSIAQLLREILFPEDMKLLEDTPGKFQAKFRLSENQITWLSCQLRLPGIAPAQVFNLKCIAPENMRPIVGKAIGALLKARE